jgi:regulatory protein
MKNRSQEPFQKAQHTALSLLARRRHSREEVRRKLVARGFEPSIVEKVLSECERLHYIDDETAADFYAAELVRKHFGLLRIRDAMRARGFDQDLINRTIDAHELLEREPKLAAAAVEKKWSALHREADGRKRREKIVLFLRSRGFRQPAISAVLDQMKTDNAGSPGAGKD